MSRTFFLAIAGLLPVCLPTAHAASFPLEKSRVEVVISGPIAELTLYQRFSNTFTEPIEATYLFPLHPDAAVDGAVMRLGEREVQAQIHTRQRAREVFEQARDSGQTASLTEQERPNVFTQSVTNILPGESIEVVLHVIQPLTYADGLYTLEVPLVVGPRFSPEGVADSDAITAPVAEGAVLHTVDITVDAELGLPLAEVWSASHPELSVTFSETAASAEISDIAADRDFVLHFDPDVDEPVVAALAEDAHFALLLEPQPDPEPAAVVPRELIFVVDHSCSMSGDPLDSVRAVMDEALSGLLPTDSFQVIRFSEEASALAPAPLPATPDNIARGRAYIAQMEGMGGTHMLAGIRAALDYPRESERKRIVCFMTDGYIGNEREILAAIEDRLGSTRLFAFGIGSSVNRFLLDRMAEVGRGGVSYVLPGDDQGAAIASFYQRIARPVLTDIELDWGSMEVSEVYPRRIPDLYAGQSVLLTGRYDGDIDEIIVRGRRGEGRHVESIALTPVSGSGISSTWARAKVADLENLQLWGEIEEVETAITTLALEHQLLTRYTSFVAVERTVRAEGQPLAIQQPLPLPAGVTFSEGVSAGLSRSAMRPGDPLITADAPEDARSVMAVFPWGEVVSLRWDPVRERWFHRFLVPREVAEDDHVITVLVMHRDGHLERTAQQLRVDATAPEFEAEARWEDGETVIRLQIEEPLRSVHVFPEGRPDERVRVDLRWEESDEVEVRLPGQWSVVEVAVKDAALNLYRQRIEVSQ